MSARQGALSAFECLSDRLGMLFEPYVVTFIPTLIKCFSHASDHVREAAQLTAKVVMSKLSAHGVKQVLMPILASLPEETQWKSRAEAIKLLGMMAHCAPKQVHHTHPSFFFFSPINPPTPTIPLVSPTSMLFTLLMALTLSLVISLAPPSSLPVCLRSCLD